MIRTATATSAVLLAASVVTVFAAFSTYEVTVENLTFKQPFSAILLAAHTEDIIVFEPGAAATDELRLLAETGNSSALQSDLGSEVNECCLCGLAVGSGELEPGDELTMTITVHDEICPNGPMFSMAAMIVNTNDGFFGINSMIPDIGGSVVKADAFDAGTEVNNQLCSHVPGPACDATSGNLQDEPAEGFIHLHRGFQEVGGDLSANDFDWNNPVAHISISVA